MSSLDDAINDYLGQKEVIAELINRFILEEEKLNPSEMVSVDVTPIFYKLKDYGSKLTLEKFQDMYRNLFLMKTEKFYFALLVEIEISKVLPIKMCLFESGLYATEIETWNCMESGGMLPCLTAVLNLSPGHCNVHGIVSEYPADYCFYMIEPVKITDDTIAELSEDLGGIIHFAKIGDDAKKRREFLSGEVYARMGISARELIQNFSDYLSIAHYCAINRSIVL